MLSTIFFISYLINDAWSLNNATTVEACESGLDEAKKPTSAPVNYKFRTDYGADMSWPMQHSSVSTNYPWLLHNIDPENVPTPEEYQNMKIQPLGNRHEVYTNYMEGCYKFYSFEACDSSERQRFEMSLRQPQSVVNYTKYGYHKIRAPEKLFKLIKEFWEANKDSLKEEDWWHGNSYVNHWANRSYMASVEDVELVGGGPELKNRIWNEAEDVIRDWTKQDLRTSSLYGIRVYKENAILATHVDRFPLISSAIINVDQDVDELWPLEVIGHDGKAHNVTMLPGDMVLYESHSLLHGRPFALKGRFMANIFIHYEPATEQQGRPSYVIKGSPQDLYSKYPEPTVNKRADESTSAHDAAAMGKLRSLVWIAENNPSLLFQQDSNGWAPIHEAARSDEEMAIRFLLSQGEDVFKQTCAGSTALELTSEFEAYKVEDLLIRVELEKYLGYVGSTC